MEDMDNVMHHIEACEPVKMDFYVDRGLKSGFIDVADSCLKGNVIVYSDFCLNINGCDENIFCHQLEGSDLVSKKEYLFAMDYLTNVLTAYKETGKEIYKSVFERVISQFHAYFKEYGPVYDDLPVYAQTLLFIKAFDVLGTIPFQEDFLKLLMSYGEWLMNDEYYQNNNNHGMFQNIALLHLSVLFGNCREADVWQKQSIKRINLLFKDSYFNDFTNNEHSLSYFKYNNFLYDNAIKFCAYYKISGIEGITDKLRRSKEAFVTFAHKDGTLPLIGDGQIVKISESNTCSRLFPDIGIAVLKVGDVYLSLKLKTVYQTHAHIDISSVTLRYKDMDFLIDTGQYNYDRYTPINRYVRSSAGHSGIFPLFADSMFQMEFCDSLQYSAITAYEHNIGDDAGFVRGEYKLKDIHVCREISVFSGEVIIKDSWQCEKPEVMRQRFVIPKSFIEKARFSAQNRILESGINNIKIRFEIIYDMPDTITVVQFGVASPSYNAYEETMLLDTFAQNTISGEITAKITFKEE